ncbi:aldehyde dehydrogenase [Chytriomyces sp. MP71]|nr:aldehyde dehydrogenase [Chytriomyces sp. MP71]
MGLIVPWNYPFHNVISPLVSAIMAGNGCVIKVSECAGWATEWLQALVSKVLELHGVDKDLVTFLDGYAEAGEALVESADKITFIGSPAVGKLVMQHASKTLTPVVLELGGKDAAIVFDDCEYDNMIKVTMRGGLQNCGQNCTGMERMVVQEGIYDRLVKDVSTLVGNIRLGTPFEKDVDLGAITMKGQMKHVQSLLDDAVSKGAKIQCGGKQFHHPKYPQGQFFEPTVITDIKPNMRIHTEEVFGPVFLIYKFKTESDAIKLANCTDFGLGSSVFTLDYAKAERVAKQVNAGSCNVNGWGFNYLCQSLPFGGIKHSGFDRFGGVEGLRGNCHVKAMTTDKLGHLGIRAQVPPILHFPIKKQSVAFQAALIEILYSVSMWEKCVGVVKLVKAFAGVDEGKAKKE